MNEIKVSNERKSRRLLFSFFLTAITGLVGVISWNTAVVGAPNSSNNQDVNSHLFQLLSTQPSANNINVSPTVTISATFSEAIDASTVLSSTFIVRGSESGIYSGVIIVAGTTIQFNALKPFKVGEVIAATITADIFSASGDQLDTSNTWEFTTSVGYASGIGLGLFDEHLLPPSGDFQSGVALGDIENDGDLDALVVSTLRDDKIYLNAGNGQFTYGSQLFERFSTDVSLGDLDGDGDLDALVAGSPSAKLMNNGEGFFTEIDGEFGTVGHTDVAIGDLNADGHLDAILVSYNYGETVWINDGTGVFTETGQVLGDSESFWVSLGDIDSDGDLDAFMGFVNGRPAKLLLNDGQGYFSDSNQNLTSEASNASVGDVDSDGDLDAVMPGRYGDAVWFNDGAGVFTSGDLEVGGHRSTLSDLDNDGDLDLIVSEVTHDNDKVFLNDGSGVFSDGGQNLGLYGPSDVIDLGDLDNDGDVDVFAIGDANQVYINRNRLDHRNFIAYIPDDTCHDYFDDFSDNTSGWPEIDDDYVLADYWQSEYRIQTKQSGFFFLFEAPDCEHHQYDVEASIRWAHPDMVGSSYGLVFGVVGDFDSYYLFDMNVDYSLFRLLRRDSSGYSIVVPVTYSSAIYPEASSNVLRAFLLKDRVGLEVNGVALGDWPVPAINCSTSAGILTSPYEDEPVSWVLFDDFRIGNLYNDIAAPCQASSNKVSDLDYFQSNQPVELKFPEWDFNNTASEVSGG